MPNQVLLFVHGKLVQVILNNKYHHASSDSSLRSTLKNSAWAELILNPDYLNLMSYESFSSMGSLAIIQKNIHLLQAKIANKEPFTIKIAIVNTPDMQRGFIPKTSIREISELNDLLAALEEVSKNGQRVAIYFPTKSQNYAIQAIY